MFRNLLFLQVSFYNSPNVFTLSKESLGFRSTQRVEIGNWENTQPLIAINILTHWMVSNLQGMFSTPNNQWNNNGNQTFCIWVLTALTEHWHVPAGKWIRGGPFMLPRLLPWLTREIATLLFQHNALAEWVGKKALITASGKDKISASPSFRPIAVYFTTVEQ